LSGALAFLGLIRVVEPLSYQNPSAQLIFGESPGLYYLG